MSVAGEIIVSRSSQVTTLVVKVVDKDTGYVVSLTKFRRGAPSFPDYVPYTKDGMNIDESIRAQARRLFFVLQCN